MSEPLYMLSLVIPVYNGERSIAELVHALESLDIEGGHEIVLVNDGSPDGSLGVCRGLVAEARVPITLINHARNYGEHNAVMTGLRHARGAWVITMDDDLQNPPSEVKRLLAFARASGKDVIYTRYKSKRHSFFRNLGSRFANWVADILLEKPKGLYLSSFRCIAAFVVEQITRYEGPYPYIDGLILQATQALGTLEVEHLPRAQGRSNYTLKRLTHLWLSIFVNFSVVPLRISAWTGFALSALGVVGVVMTVFEAIFYETPEGWASLMAALLLVSGVQLVILGIVGEYLGRLYLTANRKPQAVVRDVMQSASPKEAPGRAAIRVVERR